MHLLLISCNFQEVPFFKIPRTSHIRTVLRPTHTHIHTRSSLLVVRHSCGRKIQTLTFSQTYTRSCTCLLFNCTQTVERLCMSCQSHPHSYLQMPTDGGKDCLFLFKQMTTHTHSLVLCIQLSLICFPTVYKTEKNTAKCVHS